MSSSILGNGIAVLRALHSGIQHTLSSVHEFIPQSFNPEVAEHISDPQVISSLSVAKEIQTCLYQAFAKESFDHLKVQKKRLILTPELFKS